MRDIVNMLILTIGAWDTTGQNDEQLENEFEVWLRKLQEVLKTNREGAVKYLISAIEEEEEVA